MAFSLRDLFADKYQISEKLGINKPKQTTSPYVAPKVNAQTLFQTPAFVTPNPANNNTNSLPAAASTGFWNQYSQKQPQVLGIQNTQQYGPIRPSGSSSAGATGAPSGAFSAGGEVAGATDDIYQDEQNRLSKESQDRDRQFREQAQGIFDPLAQNFGAQLSRLPGELSSLRGGVESGARAGRDLVGKQLEGSINVLGQQEGNVRAETGKSLRNLAEDQRNTTTSISRQLGSRGAGETSAGDYAGAAIGRQGLKQRGTALESQATGLREIEGRRFEAKNIADQENSRIEQAKQQQLQSLASDFQNIQRQLEQSKAMASSDERRFIADKQNELRRDLSERLSRLEGETRQRKAALADWGTQQEVQLQNSLRLIAGRGEYDATDVMSNLSKAGNLAANLGYQATPQGADYLQETYVPGAPSGLFEPKPVKEDEDPDAAINALIESALGQGV